MDYSRFNFKVILFSIFIALAAFAFMWSLNQPYLIVAKFTFGVIFIITIAVLITYVNQSNRKVVNILSALRNLDSIPDENKGESFNQLKASIDEIIKTIKDVNIDKEITHQYFEYTLQRIDTAVISFDLSGRIILFNRAAERLLELKKPNFVEVLTRKYPDIGMLIDRGVDLNPHSISIQNGVRVLKLLGQNNEIILDGKRIRVLTLTDITNQLTDEEITSYNKLIRVMTHEIMNSVSPLKSLLNTLTQLYGKDGKPINPSDLSVSDIDNTLLALNAMHKRTLGLLQFVDSYRRLTRTPQPVKRPASIKELLYGVAILKRPEALTKDIEITVSIDPFELMVDIDESLMNQVIINLVANAVDSVENGGIIKLNAGLSYSGFVEISVEDNGMGIDQEHLDKVFTPFFTTKKEGSGIGLSFSREVVRMHGGSIDLTSMSGNGTKVTIRLPR